MALEVHFIHGLIKDFNLHFLAVLVFYKLFQIRDGFFMFVQVFHFVVLHVVGELSCSATAILAAGVKVGSEAVSEIRSQGFLFYINCMPFVI